MASNNTLSDGGLVRGTQFTATIDGYTYLFKTGARSKPIRSNFEYGADGLPVASAHARDFQKISGEIMAYAGTPEPSQLVPFTFDGVYWTVGNLTLNSSTENLRSYTCEITQLAGTSPAAFTTT